MSVEVKRPKLVRPVVGGRAEKRLRNFPSEEVAAKAPWSAELELGPCRWADDAEVFFPFEQEQLDEAEAICNGCSIRLQCLAIGMDRGEMGVWGGVYLENGRPSALPKDQKRRK